MYTLTTPELKNMIDRTEDFVLINVLSEESFDNAHIPGSVNVPHEQDGFAEKVDSIVGHDKTRKIVVYCASSDCQSSPAAAKKLTDAGFTNVFDYEDGMAGWKLAGHEVASAVKADH